MKKQYICNTDFIYCLDMENKTFNISYITLQENELSANDALLVNAAKAATRSAYAPYSHFHVGAAVALKNGEIITGNNQENAAYPSGLCAERCAVFYANAKYPEVPVCTIAIVASPKEGMFTEFPITPCGACRQVLLETENRYGRPIRLVLYGTKVCYVIERVSLLLPFQFDGSSLEE